MSDLEHVSFLTLGPTAISGMGEAGHFKFGAQFGSRDPFCSPHSHSVSCLCDGHHVVTS